jgi:hypothetical protein
MITFNHHAQVNLLSKRWWGISQNGHLDVPIEFFPISMQKSGVINMRISGVKNK